MTEEAERTATSEGVPPRRLLARVRGRAADVVAGVSVALVVVPQSLAYAQLAGMPPVRGLYAAAFPPIAAAPFSSSPYLQPGPTAVSALLTLGALAPIAPPGTPRFAELALLLALVVGAVRALVGLLRAGVIAYLMSQPLLTGFVPAAAILIVASQVPVLLGVDAPGGILRAAAWSLAHPGSWQAATLALSIGVAGIVLGARRVHPLFPGVLVAVAAATALSELGGYGGATVGSVPAGFPPVSASLPWGDLYRLLVPGVVIALIGFAEAASIARTYAALERRRWDANREFVSQGVANVAAAFTGGFPVGGSFGRSALNRLAGARTSLSSVVTGIAVLAFLPAAGALAPLPTAALGAIVVTAVVPLASPRELASLFGYSRIQWSIAAATFVLTLALAPRLERAIALGIALSVAVHLWRELELEVHAFTMGGTLHLRPRGVLWFGTARSLEDAFVGLLAEHPRARRLTIALDGLGRIDVTGALALRTLVEDARRAGLAVRIEGGPPQARRLLARVLPDLRG